MKANRKNIAMLCLAALMVVLTGCRGKQTVANSLSYYNFDSTLVNVSPSGELTVRTWGSGPDRASAINEAMKNAVAEALFTGYPTSNSYMAKPIVLEVNARERYAPYFDRFFANGGEYAKFVREASTTDKSRVESKSNGRQNYSVTLLIDGNGLRSQMRNDGIIK